MERIAFALRISADQEDDLKTTAADFNATYDEFVGRVQELGLTSLGAWLQRDAVGPMVVVFLTGEVEAYFQALRTESGVEEYIRQKLIQWIGSDVDPPEILNYPQSEALFTWLQP